MNIIDKIKSSFFEANPIYWTNKWGVFMSRKTKYSYELRREILRQYFEEQRSLSFLSNEYLIDEGTIRKWRDMYLCNGDKGIKPINNKYSGKFKEEVLEYYYTHNMLLRETAAYFNIPSTSTITKWLSLYEKDGISGLYKERRGRKLKKKSTKQVYIPSHPPKDIKELSHEEVLKELEYLRMENEVLKKYHALLRQKGLLKENK